jgi:hypothetical protein
LRIADETIRAEDGEKAEQEQPKGEGRHPCTV